MTANWQSWTYQLSETNVGHTVKYGYIHVRNRRVLTCLFPMEISPMAVQVTPRHCLVSLSATPGHKDTKPRCCFVPICDHQTKAHNEGDTRPLFDHIGRVRKYLAGPNRSSGRISTIVACPLQSSIYTDTPEQCLPTRSPLHQAHQCLRATLFSERESSIRRCIAAD